MNDGARVPGWALWLVAALILLVLVSAIYTGAFDVLLGRTLGLFT